MNKFKITAYNAPAFTRHLETLTKLSADPNGGPYCFDLFSKLKRLENKANRIVTLDCNGEIDSEKAETELNKIENKVKQLLPGLKSFFINGDPRGYSLKIGEAEAKALNMWSDWGGYGILAPEF